MGHLKPREYSHRLGVLTPDQLQAALDRFGLGRLLAAEPCPGGLFGQNVFLTSSEGGFVLRGHPHYDWQFPQEAWFAKAIAERTSVPAPWPYLIETDTAVFGWSYAIMPRLRGLNVADPPVREKLSEDDKVGIAAALGAGLARLHHLTSDFYGPWDRELSRPVPDPRPFRQVILESLETWYERCLAASPVTTPEDIDWCRGFVQQYATALDEPFQPTVMHHDYKEANSVFERGPDGWRLSGVFDLMECCFSDPEEDFVRSIYSYGPRNIERSKAFIAAYRAVLDLRPGYRERFLIYILRDCLVIWEYGQRNGVWFDPDTTLRPWLDPFLAIDPFA
jgi:hygromycin-B 7''-O-kinase